MLQTYPEFCRQLLYESGSPDFIEATAEWERVYGKVSQVKDILFAPIRKWHTSIGAKCLTLMFLGWAKEICALVPLHGG